MRSPPGGLCSLLIATVLFVFISNEIEGAVPVTKICRASSCTGIDCLKTTCVNGNCSPEGACICTSCYSGTSCEKLNNNHYPEFRKQHDSLIVSALLRAGDLVTTMSAVDRDTNLTCHYDNDNCPCSQMLYSIESGNTDNLFVINEYNGAVSVASDVSNYVGSVYKLYLSVVNRAVDGASGDLVGPKSYAVLTVGIGSVSSDGMKKAHDQDDSYMPHARHRRAAGSYVNNITFSLIKTGVYNYTTTMMVGSKIHFQMQITFPQGTTDLDVELFTPDPATVMVICNAQITWKGSNIAWSNANVAPVLSSNDGSFNYDWAVINFGNVTNNGAQVNNVNDTQIFIEWDVVMLDTAVNNTQYWVSAGAQYNSQNEIWIGQAGFNTLIDNYNTSTTSSPSFNISGPGSGIIGQSLLFHVDMFLPAPVSDIVFEAFAPVNYTDSLTLCNVMVVSAGRNYECLPIQNLGYTLYPSKSGFTNERATLTVGHIINAGSRESPPTPQADSVIGIDFVVYLPPNATWVGQTVWVGAAVAIGTDQIWAGEIGFLVNNITVPDFVATPQFTLNASVSASINMPVLLEYNMTLVNNTDTTYSLLFQVPPLRFKVCQIQLNYQGSNIPCLHTTTPNYDQSQGAYTWNLGRIRDTGSRVVSLDAWTNTMQFIIYVLPLNISTNAPGSAAATFTATMTYGNLAAINSTLVTFVASASAVSNSTSPLTTMSFKYGNGIVPVNASTDVRIDIGTYPGTVYTPVYLEITVPYGNNSNIYSICRVEVVSVGVNLPCVNQTALNASIQYYTMSNYSGYYKAVIQLDSVCNSYLSMASNATYLPTVNDTIELSVIVRAENSVTLAANGTVNWVGAGLSYTPGILWLGSESITTMQYTNMDYNTSLLPYVNVDNAQQSNWSTVPAGSLASFLVTIKLPPQSVGDWSVRATAQSDTMLSVCSVHIKQYGRGIPCLNTSTPMRSIDRPNFQGRNVSWIEMYKLTNVGMDALHYDPVFDNNSVVVEVLVQVGAGAVVGSTHSVLISVDHGMNGADNSTLMSFNVGPPAAHALQNSTLPTASLFLSPVNSNATIIDQTVYKGQTVIMTAEVTLPTGTQNDIVLTLMSPTSPASAVDIVAFDVIFTGPNLPCIARKQFTSNITSYLGSYTRDMAVMNLGTVCNWPVDTSLPDNDKVRIEAVVTILRNSSLPANTNIVMTALLNVNGTDMTPLANYTMILTDTISTTEYPSVSALNMADLQLNVTNTSAVQMYPADYFTLYADIIVPANSTMFSLVDIKLPVDNISAAMTVFSMTVESFGVNLGSFELGSDFIAVTNSTYATSQMDRVYVNFGKLTNTGHTYRADKYQYGDDNIRIKVVMQMADAQINTQNSMHTVSLGARIGMPMIFRNLQVQTKRLLNEVPDLAVVQSLNTTVNTTTGQLVNIDFFVRHTNLSRAETYNTSVYIYTSDYAIFSTLLSTNYTGIWPNVTNMTANSGIIINFDHVYFTDIIQFTIQLMVVPTSKAAKSGDVQVLTVTTCETLYDVYYRPLHSNNYPGKVFQTLLTSFNFTTIPSYVSGCAGAALGMESGLIQDCQLSASYSPDPTHQALNARYSVSVGWVSASRAGAHIRYYQVNFNNLTLVSAINLYPSSSGSQVTQYKLHYSNDGINWIDGEIVSTTGSQQDTLQNPIESMYLRVEILAPAMNTDNVGFAVEFIGCVTGDMLIPVTGQCNVRQGYQEPTASLTQFSPRNFLLATTHVYFCDTAPSGSITCFTTTDLTPTNWMKVDTSVVNVLGYLPAPGQLFGIDSTKRAIMISEDNGQTWMSLSLTRYTTSSTQTGFIPAKIVPWQYDPANLPAGNTPTTYTISAWGATFDGVATAGVLKADWNSCCA